MELVRMKDHLRFKMQVDLNSCVNNALKNSFEFDLNNGKITKQNSQNYVEISKENKEFVVEFMKDICSISSFPKMLTKETDPALLGFYISSLHHLEKTIDSQESQEILYEILNLSINKVLFLYFFF